MRKKIVKEDFIGKSFNGIEILEILPNVGKRRKTICKCHCKKVFEAEFYNVCGGGYKSCGCLQYISGINNRKWNGFGEISKSYFYHLSVGAKDRNLKFDITLPEIWEIFLKQNRKCVYSGKVLKFSSSRNSHDGTASLDRIDPKKGYVKNNVQWVHQDVNFMKQDMKEIEFLDLISEIYNYYPRTHNER